jgi:ribosomal protein S18 acetylase RimI-like enzyme
VSPIEESNAHYDKAWSAFALASPRGEVMRGPGVLLVTAGVTWPGMNLAFLSAPVNDVREVGAAVEFAVEFYRRRGRIWLFLLCDDWVPRELQGALPAVFEKHGMRPAMDSIGMLAQSLKPTERPLPALEFRRVEDLETRLAMADINAAAYGIPLEWGREAVDVENAWRSPVAGYIGYAGGHAVTTAMTMPIDDAIFVGWVATLPEHQGRGYAEAVMRHALGEACAAHGIERSVLHATLAGRPLYERMGYEVVTRFTTWFGRP